MFIVTMSVKLKVTIKHNFCSPYDLWPIFWSHKVFYQEKPAVNKTLGKPFYLPLISLHPCLLCSSVTPYFFSYDVFIPVLPKLLSHSFSVSGDISVSQYSRPWIWIISPPLCPSGPSFTARDGLKEYNSSPTLCQPIRHSHAEKERVFQWGTAAGGLW